MTSTQQMKAGWSSQAQEWYTRHDLIEHQWAPLSAGLLDLAEVAAGDRVLDLASGVGDPAIAAALRVGPTGSVLATDIAPDMLAFAARRAAAAGLTTVEVHEMDAEAIDLPDTAFDVVLSRLGLMFLTDLDATFSGVARVLTPGGRFAAAIPWRPRENALPQLVGALLGALDLPPDAGRGSGPGIFSLSDASTVVAAMDRAGLVDLRLVPYTITHDHADAAEWIDFVLQLNIPLRARLVGIGDERMRAAERAGAAVAARWTTPGGRVRFPMHGYYALGRRAA